MRRFTSCPRLERFLLIEAIGTACPFAARLVLHGANGNGWPDPYFTSPLPVLLFNAMPITLLAFLFSRRASRAGLVTAVVVLAFTFITHATLDLSRDPQAGVAVLLIPIYTLPILLAVYAVAVTIEWLVGRMHIERTYKGRKGEEKGRKKGRKKGRESFSDARLIC